MPRRATRPSSAGSLHICKPEMSGVGSVSCAGESSGEPRVVVQQLPAVEPAEGGGERLTPAPYPPTPLDKQQSGLEEVQEEVRTRLRPHRSSWRLRFSPPDKKEVVGLLLSGKAPLPRPSTESSQRGKTKGSTELACSLVHTKSLTSPAARQRYANYPSEDIACIQRNSERALKRERTPSTDSAPEIPLPEKSKPSPVGLKRRGRPPSNVSKVSSAEIKKGLVQNESRTSSTESSSKLLSKNSQELKQKNPTHLSTQQNEKQSQIGFKVKLRETNTELSLADSKKIGRPKIESKTKRVKPRSLRPPVSQSDSPGYCESCNQEFVYLQWHLQTKHKIVHEENTLISPKPKYVPKGRHIKGKPRKYTSESGPSAVLAAGVIAESGGEAERIARTVEGDVLIQQFGVRLLGMSLAPQQKVLAVAARMVELVRLLRAAQGLEPTLQSLTHLLHTQHWPLITEAILYVAGFQESDGTFRNSTFVFDIGQALKFSAYILKNEAAVNMNKNYEQQLKEFMNSIDGKINEILPGSFEFKHMLEADADEGSPSTSADKTGANKIQESATSVVTLPGKLNGSADPHSLTQSPDVILPDILDVAELITISSDFAASSEPLTIASKSLESPEKGEGERQASLLLGLSKAFTSNSEVKSLSLSPVSQLQKSLPEEMQSQTVTQTNSESNLDSESSNEESKLIPTNIPQEVDDSRKDTSTKVRFVKIISANSKNTLGQINKRKFCLLIPSQTVQNSASDDNATQEDPLEKEVQQIMSGEVSSLSVLPSADDGLQLVSECGETETRLHSSPQPEPRQSLANLCGLNLELDEA